jgi:hypothetical protein
VDAWLNPWADPSDGGYQIIRALTPLPAAGIQRGRQNPLINGRTPVPAMHNDFIFAAVGEDLRIRRGLRRTRPGGLLVFRGLGLPLGPVTISARCCRGLTASPPDLIITAGNLKLIPLSGVTFRLSMVGRACWPASPSWASCGDQPPFSGRAMIAGQVRRQERPAEPARGVVGGGFGRSPPPSR